MLIMQVHTHLLKNEVIGFMAGYNIKCSHTKKNSASSERESRKKTLVISEVYPAESLN